MTKRFSQHDSPFSDSSTACGTGSKCKCCAAIRKAREQEQFDPLPNWNSPLTPGVQLASISYGNDGANLRVELAEDWSRMFEQLPVIGTALVMTRNSGAILGKRMTYPKLAVTSGGDKAAGGEAGLLLEFRHFSRAHAIHQRRESGHLFGVEFTDHAGNIVHRFTLTPDSDMDEFFGWVRLHQACTAHRASPYRQEENDHPLPGRMLDRRECDQGVLSSIVATSVDRAVPLRATVRSAAVTQRANVRPVSLQPSDDWWFLSDDETGLHFHPDRFTSISLERHAQEYDGARTLLRAVTDDGVSALVLEAARPDFESVWRELLETVA